MSQCRFCNAPSVSYYDCSIGGIGNFIEYCADHKEQAYELGRSNDAARRAQAEQPAAPKSLRDMTEEDFQQAHGVSSAIGHVVKTSPVEVKMYACVGYGDLLKVGTKLYARPDPRIAELERDLAAAQAEAAALRKIVNGDVAHIYQGQCPDEDDWSARDPDCHACQILGPYVNAIDQARGGKQ